MDVQIANTPWNVFEKTFYQDNSTTQYEYIEYKEKNVNVSGITEYRLINQDLDLPLLISDSFIHVACKIVRSDTGADINTGQIALNNNAFNIFSNAWYYMNDQSIEELIEVGVTTLVKGLLDFTKGYTNGLESEFWIPDDGLVFQENSFQAIRHADGMVLTINGTSGAGLFRVTKAGGANFANGDVIDLFYGGKPIHAERTRIHTDGNGAVDDFRTTVETNFVAVFVDNNNATVDVEHIEQFNTFRLFTNDGQEVVLFADQVKVSLNATAGAHLELDTRPGQAFAAGRVITAKNFAYDFTLSTNTGFQKRKLKALNNVDGVTFNKTIHLFLPIKRLFKIFDFNSHIFRGIKHEIKLSKNTNYKTLFMRDNLAQNGRLDITDISWWVPILKPSIEYGLKLDKELNSGTKTKLEWNQLRCVASSEFTSNTGVGGQTSWRIVSAGNKPVRVFIVFRVFNQYNPSANQDSTNNAMAFYHMNITRIQLRINSMQFPREEYTADFVTNDDWTRLYMQYLQMTGKTYESDGGGAYISYDNFKKFYPIFCFDLSKQDPQIWANVTQADMELRFTRSTELTAPNNTNFIIYAIIEFERFIQLSGTNNRMTVIL